MLFRRDLGGFFGRGLGCAACFCYWDSYYTEKVGLGCFFSTSVMRGVGGWLIAVDVNSQGIKAEGSRCRAVTQIRWLRIKQQPRRRKSKALEGFGSPGAHPLCPEGKLCREVGVDGCSSAKMRLGNMNPGTCGMGCDP